MLSSSFVCDYGQLAHTHSYKKLAAYQEAFLIPQILILWNFQDLQAVLLSALKATVSNSRNSQDKEYMFAGDVSLEAVRTITLRFE